MSVQVPSQIRRTATHWCRGESMPSSGLSWPLVRVEHWEPLGTLRLVPCPNCDDGAVLGPVCCRMYRQTGECCGRLDQEYVECETCGGDGRVPADRQCVNCGGREADGQALTIHEGELWCAGYGDCDRREYGRGHVRTEIAAIEEMLAAHDR